MISKETTPVKTLDGVLKSLLILSRTVDHVLEKEAVKAAVNEQFSPSKVQILRLLGVQRTETSSRIARFLGVSKPAVTQLIDSMVRRKLVVRRVAKHDRREVDLCLTEKGKQVFQAVRREQRHLLRTALKQAAGANPEKWIKMLGEVTDALTQSGITFEEFCLQCGAHADETCVLGRDDSQCLLSQSRNLSAKAPNKKMPRRGANRVKAPSKRGRRR